MHSGFVVQPTYRVREDRPVVQLFGRLEGGETFLVEDNRFRPYFFVPKQQEAALATERDIRVEATELRDLRDREVVRVTARIPAAVPHIRNRLLERGCEVLEGDIRFAYRYLIDRGIRGAVAIDGPYEVLEDGLLRFRNPEIHPSRGRPALRTLSLDLETSRDASRIFSAALAGCDIEEVHLLSKEPVEGARDHPDERLFLAGLMARIRELDPDILVGWNVVDFDLRVLAARCQSLHLACHLGRIEGEIRFQRDPSFARQSRAEIPGRMVLDGIPLVRDAVRLRDYRLETAARSLLGRGKRIDPGLPDAAAEIERMYRDTSTHTRPTLNIATQSVTGAATNIIAGLGVGMFSTGIPALILALAIIGAYEFSGLYGIAIAAVGMLSVTGIQLAVDAYGPISDNAGGIAEMAQLPPEVRERTDKLDAVGNTTAAIGKGFAIASAALTALALFAAFMQQAGVENIDVAKPKILAGLLIGAVLPYVFSAMAMGAVGRAAGEMIKEVGRQFKEIPGLREGTAKAEYAKCVDISTRAAIREMVAPGILALAVPVLIGFIDKDMLGGLLAGVTVSGVLFAIFQSNAGGAWDNAKKRIESGITIDGILYGKGSEAHKAAVVGDTVGDPFKDTSGPSLNILIKLIAVVALVIAPLIA